MSLKVGDFARIREEWREPGEEKYIYLISEINEETNRCLITCLNSSLSIQPTETVELQMIEKI